MDSIRGLLGKPKSRKVSFKNDVGICADVATVYGCYPAIFDAKIGKERKLIKEISESNKKAMLV